MGLRFYIFIGALSIFAYYLYSALSYVEKPIHVPSTGYFGQGAQHADDTTIHPFHINVPEQEIESLKNRLRNSRIGHSQLEDVNDFQYGFNLKTLLRFKDYWLNEYDWRKHERELNSFPQFTTEIEGLKIHFIHLKPSNPQKYKRVIPLLLVHGWPGNVYEFHKILPLLANPPSGNIAFEVVAPSIPGYGWSEAAHKKGFGQIASARVFNKLMKRLKHAKYLAQGGDWGALVTVNIAKLYPESLLGLHLNMMTIAQFTTWKLTYYQIVGSLFPHRVFAAPEFANYSMATQFFDLLRESGYYHLQATKPDTVGVGLNDSPIGLMVYILEKFSTWTNPSFRFESDGALERKFTKDELLTTISIYWFNGNILSSQRYYKEFFNEEQAFTLIRKYVATPTGYAALPHDIGERQPVEIVSEMFNVSQYTLFSDGGHFAAFEMPKELAKDIFDFAKKL